MNIFLVNFTYLTKIHAIKKMILYFFILLNLNITGKNIFRYILIFSNSEILRIKNPKNTILSNYLTKSNENDKILYDFEKIYLISENAYGKFRINTFRTIEDKIHKHELQHIVDQVNSNGSKYCIEIQSRFGIQNQQKDLEKIHFFVKFISINLSNIIFWKINFCLCEKNYENHLNEQEIATIIHSSFYFFIDDDLNFSNVIFELLLDKEFNFESFGNFLKKLEQINPTNTDLTCFIEKHEIFSKKSTSSDRSLSKIEIDSTSYVILQNKKLFDFLRFFYAKFYLWITDEYNNYLFQYIVGPSAQKHLTIKTQQFLTLQARIRTKEAIIVPTLYFLSGYRNMRYPALNLTKIDLTQFIIHEFKNKYERIYSKSEEIQYFCIYIIEANDPIFIIDDLEFKFDSIESFKCINQKKNSKNRLIIYNQCFHILLSLFVQNQFSKLSYILIYLFKLYIQVVINIENENFTLEKIIILDDFKDESCSIDFDHGKTFFVSEYLGRNLFLILRQTLHLDLKNISIGNNISHKEYIYGFFSSIKISKCFYFDIFHNHDITFLKLNQTSVDFNEIMPIFDSISYFSFNNIIQTSHSRTLIMKKSIFRLFFMEFLFAYTKNKKAIFHYYKNDDFDICNISHCHIRFYNKIPDNLDKMYISDCLLNLNEKFNTKYVINMDSVRDRNFVCNMERTIFSHCPIFIFGFSDVVIHSCIRDFELIVNENVNITVSRHNGLLIFNQKLSFIFANENSFFEFTNIQHKIYNGKTNFQFTNIKFDNNIFVDLFNYTYIFNNCYIKRGVEILFYYGIQHIKNFVVTAPMMTIDYHHVNVSFQINRNGIQNYVIFGTSTFT